MAPTFRQLRYFVVLAEELHYGRSAKRLNISQPPLSTSIRHLERDVGVALFDRTSRQVVLTAAGHAFTDRARRLLSDLEDSTDFARTIAFSPAGALRVGFVPSMAFLGLSEIIGRFKQGFPGCAVDLREMNSAVQLASLADKRIELGFVHQFSRQAEPMLDGVLIARQRFVCAIPAGHRLARLHSVSLGEIAQEPLLLFARERAPAFHDHITQLFARAGARPTITHHIGSWLTITALVSLGLGVAIVPNALAKVGMNRVVFVPTTELWAEYAVHCVWSKRERHATRDRFVECVKRLRKPRK